MDHLTFRSCPVEPNEAFLLHIDSSRSPRWNLSGVVEAHQLSENASPSAGLNPHLWPERSPMCDATRFLSTSQPQLMEIPRVKASLTTNKKQSPSHAAEIVLETFRRFSMKFSMRRYGNGTFMTTVKNGICTPGFILPKQYSRCFSKTTRTSSST